MARVVACPFCRRQLRLPGDLLGQLVQCPSCKSTFTAPKEDPFLGLVVPPTRGPGQPPVPAEVDPIPAPVPPQLRPLGSGDDRIADTPAAPPAGQQGERAGFDFPDEDWDEDQERSRYGPGAGRGLGLRGLSSAYRLELGQWFAYAGAHYGPVIGPAVGYLVLSFLMGVAASMVPCGGILFRFCLEPALQAGFTVVYLAQLKGQSWTFADFFAGFNWYGALIANFVLTLLIFVGCLLPFVVLVVLVAQAPPRLNPWLLLVCGSVPIVLLTTYVMLRTTCFSVLLIVDRDCNALEAIKGSWQLSEGHVLGLLGVWVLLGLLAFAGLLLLGVGLLFTLPLAGLAYTAGYLLVAGSRPPLRTADRPRREPGRLDLEEI